VFVPALRKENGDVVAMRLQGTGATQSNGAAKPGQTREEAFQEIDAPLYPQTRLKKLLDWQKVTKIGPGLLNLGNTCFCNSILQCLAYTPPLANFCLNHTHSKRVPPPPTPTRNPHRALSPQQAYLEGVTRGRGGVGSKGVALLADARVEAHRLLCHSA